MSLGRVDDRRARDDHVGAAVGDVEVAVVVDPAYVAEGFPFAPRCSTTATVDGS